MTVSPRWRRLLPIVGVVAVLVVLAGATMALRPSANPAAAVLPSPTLGAQASPGVLPSAQPANPSAPVAGSTSASAPAAPTTSAAASATVPAASVATAPTPSGQSEATPSAATATPAATADPATAVPSAVRTAQPTPRPTVARTPTATVAPTPSPTSDPNADLVGGWTAGLGSTVSATVTAGVGPFQDQVVASTRSVVGRASVLGAAGGNVLSSSEFVTQTADLSTGDALKDSQLRPILETDRYPTAEFHQTSPTDLPSFTALRAGADLVLRGNLTLHGVTRAVSIPARATLVGSTINVVASLPFRLADYDIRGSGFVSVGDTGAIGVRLVLTR